MHVKSCLTTLSFCVTILGSAAFSAAGAAEHRVSSETTQSKIQALVNSEARPAKHKARDQYRRPVETLTFCGVEPSMNVVEIWPGGQGGWYRRIISPLMEEGGGSYFPVTNRTGFPDQVEDLNYGAADIVFVFRAHGFMIYDAPAQDHVNEVFEMVRPGGVLCIVDHAGDENIPQDPEGENGYVNESHFRMMAEQAGFALIATSDHNRNPKDDKDHPRGVYSLPPTLSGTLPLSKERKAFLEIGESDRFTHKYAKPE